MYQAYFGLTSRPFAAAANAKWYHPAEAIAYAHGTLKRAMRRGEGTGLVVGPTGTGKTLLLSILAEDLREDHDVVLLAAGRISTRRALLQAILHGLGRPFRQRDEGELRLDLVDYLTTSDEGSRGLVLLVDEAQLLPLRLLEELRLLTDVARDGNPSVRLTLAGNATFEERLSHPKLEPFNQRIVARCYLESFKRTETEAYVRAQFERAGRGDGDLLEDGACEAVWQATDGVPRLVNQLCDHALLVAFSAGRPTLDTRTVEEAWADLQQLPAPAPAVPGAASRNGSDDVVEFGGLDDDVSDPEVSQPGDAADEEDLDPCSLSFDAGVPEAEEEDLDVVDIDETVAEDEVEFRPAGTIRPELELVCPDMAHPIDEEFEEEEIIVAGRLGFDVDEDLSEDNEVYSLQQPDVGLFGVETAEDPQAEPCATIQFRRDATDEEEESAAADDEALSVEDEQAPSEPDTAGRDVSEAAIMAELAEMADMIDKGENRDFETLSMVSPTREEPVEPPLIVVEESPEETDAVADVTPVRARQYGQLFAQLRRGSM